MLHTREGPTPSPPLQSPQKEQRPTSPPSFLFLYLDCASLVAVAPNTFFRGSKKSPQLFLLIFLAAPAIACPTRARTNENERTGPKQKLTPVPRSPPPRQASDAKHANRFASSFFARPLTTLATVTVQYFLLPRGVPSLRRRVCNNNIHMYTLIKKKKPPTPCHAPPPPVLLVLTDAERAGITQPCTTVLPTCVQQTSPPTELRQAARRAHRKEEIHAQRKGIRCAPSSLRIPVASHRRTVDTVEPSLLFSSFSLAIARLNNMEYEYGSFSVANNHDARIETSANPPWKPRSRATPLVYFTDSLVRLSHYLAVRRPQIDKTSQPRAHL